MSTAIILAGHGSHITPETAGVVWSHVDRLRAMRVADEVTAAFWKEAPSFHQVLRTLEADDVTIVPLFTAQGYFTQTVIPTEMNLPHPTPPPRERTIRYTPTLSEHPYISQVVRQRIEDALQLLGVTGQQVAVAVIGHSTRRNPESRKATEAQAEQVRQWGIVAQVQAVYLDDSPAIADIYGLTDAPILIAVPFFLALGSHTTIDVPAALGLAEWQTSGQIKERMVYYTRPVGVEASLGEVILELVRESGMTLYPPSDGSTWDGFPKVGHERFLEWVAYEKRVKFGELEITLEGVQVWGDTSHQIIPDLPTLRRVVRENPFRPLAASSDLPRGWRIEPPNLSGLPAIIETIYPGALADWANEKNGGFVPIPLATTLERQTGNYRQLTHLDPTALADLVTHICGQCVCQPRWADDTPPTPTTIPCREACNFWMSRAWETLEKASENG
ncbi:MAG: hypothetical protein DPW16_00175 [Chloroflexi bacterium]|nr:hypothetical protein [Chloroflexota bacterium]